MSKRAFSVLFAQLCPVVVFAAGPGVLGVFDTLISFVQEIIPLLIAIAILVFFWGLVKFIAHAGDEKVIAEAKQLIVWGLIGIFVIVALWSIVGYIQSSLGLDVSTGGGVAPSLPTTLPAS